jgi:hypothetical protein
MRNDEGALAGAPDDLPSTVAPASDPLHVTDEYRGGPIATARLIFDAYVRDDLAWNSIQPSRPDDDVQPDQDATIGDTGGEAEA